MEKREEAGMKNLRECSYSRGSLAVALMFFCFVAAGVAMAANPCEQCSGYRKQMLDKENQIKSLEAQIKALRPAPKAQNQNKAAQKPKPSAPRPVLIKQQKMAQMQKNNPQRYALVSQKDRLYRELKVLGGQFNNCNKTCNSGQKKS